MLSLHIDDDYANSEFLRVLNKSAPINLREIKFYAFLKISLKTLEEFLANWKVKRQPALKILTFDPGYEKKNIRKK